MDIDDGLYRRVVCALMHDTHACAGCRKCGSTYIEARMNLVIEMAKALGRPLPWDPGFPETPDAVGEAPAHGDMDGPVAPIDDMEAQIEWAEDMAECGEACEVL